MSDDTDLLSIDRGSVIAPAGCGKTECIVSAVARHVGSKPILVLTHTNAGIAELRARFQRKSIPNKKFVLSTIDGWCIKLGQSFTMRSGLTQSVLSVENPGTDYPAIRKAVADMLGRDHLNNIIKANYAQLLVDEYQDCNVIQHRIVTLLSSLLPTCVLGDPLQAIFGFAEPVVSWSEVESSFERKAQITVPWRWKKAGNEALGNWVLSTLRPALKNKLPLDIASGPSGLEYVQLSNNAEANIKAKVAKYFELLRRGTVLVIGDSKNAPSRHNFSRSVRRCGIVEAVDMRDFIRLGKDLDATHAKWSALCNAFGDSVTGINSGEIGKRLETIRAGRQRLVATDFELAALAAADNGSPSLMLAALDALDSSGKPYRVFRQQFFACIKRMLQLKIQSPAQTYLQSATKVREQARFSPRVLERGCIGSTLLLKGLEADSVLILDGENIAAAGAKNLYVALTRGRKNVVVFAKSSILSPTLTNA